MEITEALLHSLSAKAKASEKLRVAYDLRTTLDDNSQRLLNAMEPGAILPIYRHQKTSESVFVLRGAIREKFFDNEGKLIDTFDLKAGKAVSFAQHNTECLESGTIIFESKDGKYEPLNQNDIMTL